MHRTILERVAGSFDALTTWGLYSVAFVILNLLADRVLGGYEASSSFALFLLVLSVLVTMCGWIGMVGVRIYCFWFNKTDPTDPDAQ